MTLPLSHTVFCSACTPRVHLGLLVLKVVQEASEKLEILWVLKRLLFYLWKNFI